MKTSELRQKNKDELAGIVAQNREKLAGLQFDMAGGKLKNLSQIRAAKLEIARALTLIGEADAKGGKETK